MTSDFADTKAAMQLRAVVRSQLLALTLVLCLSPLAAAQQVGKVPRVGVLGVLSPEGLAPYASAFREGLRELGYVEGQNVAIEWRYAHGKAERFPDLAAELVRLGVDVIWAPNDPAIAAAQGATRTIPIVMMLARDPVAMGFVASLARPGGNITGLSTQAVELVGKRLQLLGKVVPKLSRLAVLFDPTEPGPPHEVREIEVAARVLGVQVQLVEARSPDELDSAFTAMAREGAGAVSIVGSTMPFVHRARIAELAARSRLPTMCALREYVEAGCLMSYNPSLIDLARRSGYYVGRILKGTKPADLPVEQPTKFELIVNARTAKALGLTIPPSLLVQADQLIN